MPDDGKGTRGSLGFTEAADAVDRYVATIPGAGRLEHVRDNFGKRDYRIGWRVSVDYSDDVRRELYILADQDFPYTPPRIALADPPDILAWPHLEADGLLCVFPTDAAVSNEDPAGVVRLLLGEACKLIEESASGSNIEDFRDEFLSYWGLATDPGARDFTSLLEPQGPSRRISIWRGEKKRIVGEDRDTVTRWLTRRGIQKRGRTYNIDEGVLIWLPQPLIPAEYPRAAADVRALAEEHSTEAVDILDGLISSTTTDIEVVFGFNTPNGACFAGVTVPARKTSLGPGRGGDVLTRGFRPGRVPPRVLVRRFFSGASKVTKASVKRADHRWVHGRDRDSRQTNLRQANVAIVGCGSLGGPLARLLAQAGIGNLLLIDPESMEWPNISRHQLGAGSVDQPKAHEIASEIENAFPHIGDVSSKRVRFGPSTREVVEELTDCDLIISTTGNWSAESFLNETQKSRDDYPPILYGWVEPNAAAAHAVLISKEGACLRCGTNDKGRPILQVTTWPDESDILQEPACGGLFSPYGPAELCWAHALLAETVIEALAQYPETSYHRAWIGRRDRIAAGGGTFTREWIEQMGDPGAGGITAERRWPASNSCPVCARPARAA